MRAELTAAPDVGFDDLYRQTSPQVLAFIARRVPAGEVEDVAARTYLAVWRRFVELPPDADGRRAWVFGVARNCVLDAYRSQRRGDALVARLTGVPDVPLAEPSATVDLRLDVARAWASLEPIDQDALALVVLDGLSPAEAATVTDISAAAFRVRLMRARQRLRAAMEGVQR